jgi:hypothetical protein
MQGRTKKNRHFYWKMVKKIVVMAVEKVAKVTKVAVVKIAKVVKIATYKF